MSPRLIYDDVFISLSADFRFRLRLITPLLIALLRCLAPRPADAMTCRCCLFRYAMLLRDDIATRYAISLLRHCRWFRFSLLLFHMLTRHCFFFMLTPPLPLIQDYAAYYFEYRLPAVSLRHMKIQCNTQARCLRCHAIFTPLLRRCAPFIAATLMLPPLILLFMPVLIYAAAYFSLMPPL